VFRSGAGGRSGKPTFEQQLKRGKQRGWHYIWLPNDHTAGAASIPLPPDQLVAQNDAALGRIIETIAQSPLWKESLILVTETMPERADHVDATRTVALRWDRYVRRKTVISDRYDQLSLLRTIGLLLGLFSVKPERLPGGPMFTLFYRAAGFPAPSHCLSPLPSLRAGSHTFQQGHL